MYMNLFEFHSISILLPLIQIRIVILHPVFDLNSNSIQTQELNWNLGVILNSILNFAQACQTD